MHGLEVIIITQKIRFLDIDASVADLKNLNFSLCNFLTPVENIVIIWNMNLVSILVVKFFAILVVALLVK